MKETSTFLSFQILLQPTNEKFQDILYEAQGFSHSIL